MGAIHLPKAKALDEDIKKINVNIIKIVAFIIEAPCDKISRRKSVGG